MADSTLVDPLGRPVVLHDRTWYGHILRGHPELAACRALVNAAVEEPELIRRSTADVDCRLYYGAGPRTVVRIVVVADVAVGIVKTAYLTKKESAGAIEWSRPTV